LPLHAIGGFVLQELLQQHLMDIHLG
jgi:hypothetical protein